MAGKKGQRGGGGARAGAGRKSKAEEAGLKDLLDSCISTADRKNLFAKLKEKALLGEDYALGLLLAYLYGKPVQQVAGTLDSDLTIRIEYGNRNPHAE